MAPFPATHRNVVAKTNRALPVKPKKPGIPRAPKPKPVDPNQVATDNAMSAFRVALGQLQATPPVDSAAIMRPYQDASVAAGQLGTGLQQAVQGAGQAAQTQYATGRDVAQQRAAAFGISAGSGANPTALQDTGTPAIAQQTQAYATAAPQAASSWQQLLLRTGTNNVGQAQAQRDQNIATGRASLAGSIPGAIQNEKQLGFQQDTAKKNFALAVGTQRDRATNDLRDYLLGVTKTRIDAGQAQTKAELDAENLAEKKRHNLQTETTASKRLTASQKTATAKGIKGISTVNTMLKPATGSKGQKPITGYDVTYLADPDGISAGGPPIRLTVKNPNTAQPPSGYIKPKDGMGKPVYGQATAGATTGITLATWNRALAVLKSQNPGVPAGQLIPLLPAKPKK